MSQETCHIEMTALREEVTEGEENEILEKTFIDSQCHVSIDESYGMCQNDRD